MQLFYCENLVLATDVILSQEESYHASQVLRMRNGDSLHLTDGLGRLFKGVLVSVDSKKSMVHLTEEIPQRNVPSSLHIAIAPTKNIDRFEWFLEKSTEMGIKEITPLLCRYSERKEIKPERLNKVIVSAAKQSHHFLFPQLNPLTKVDEFMKKTETRENKYIAHCEPSSKNNFIKSITNKQNVILMIGPEGDFSESEIQLAISNHFTPVSLGEYRLRTETAGVYASAVFNAINP
ncbi:MAG: 16S rRNA (uracil(1498)-N(3))-methyltransferase [Bacteroidota bacterium]